MAFVSFDQKDLAQILTCCNLISPRKSEIDLFTYTKISLAKDTAQFTAISSTLYYTNNLQFGRSDGKIEGVSWLVKTDLIANAVNLISDDMIGLEFDLEKHTLIITGSNSKHTLRIETRLLADFTLPSTPKEDVLVDCIVKTDELLSANKLAFTAVGNPKIVYQPEFLSVCYHVQKEAKKLLVVSTDRYRMAKTLLDCEFTQFSLQEEACMFLVSPKNLQFITHCVGSEEQLTLSFGKDFLTIDIGSSSLTMRYGDGKFPDYDKIIPQSFSCSFTIHTQQALQSLKQVYFSARTNVINKNVLVTISPTTKKITLESKTDDGNSSESTIDMENYEGVTEEWNQSFNADYLMDYISSVSTDTIVWEANPGKPSVLSPEKQKDRTICLISGLR
jgi:DNA polymerase III sliding clamp (beta) subunit (PCNA family)